MQSTLQVLLNLREFRTDIQSISKRKLDEKNMKLIREFQNIIKEKEDKYNYIVNPIGIKKILREVNIKYYKNEQEDANEFLNLLLNEMLKEVKGIGKKNNNNIQEPKEKKEKEAFDILENKFFINNDSFLIELFYGRLKRIIYCEKKHIIKVNFNVFNIIQLPDSDKEITFEDLLIKFQEEKKVETEIYCEKCDNVYLHYYSKNIIYNLPYYLILNLNNKNLIQFNEKFTINANNFLKEDNNNNDTYILNSIISYYGNGKNGHYYSKCRITFDKWIFFNDNIYYFPQFYLASKYDVIFIFQKYE